MAKTSAGITNASYRGCVNYLPKPEEVRKWDSRNLGSVARSFAHPWTCSDNSLLIIICSRFAPQIARKTSAKSNPTPPNPLRNRGVGFQVPPHRRQIPNRGRSHFAQPFHEPVYALHRQCAPHVSSSAPSSCALTHSLARSPLASLSISRALRGISSASVVCLVRRRWNLWAGSRRGDRRRRHPLMRYRVCQRNFMTIVSTPWAQRIKAKAHYCTEVSGCNAL